MKLIKTEEAVGHVLCHDMTQIIPGVVKDARFRKGHVVTEKDIPVLLSIGKEHLYVWEKQEGMLHEDEAALRLEAMCKSDGMHATAVKEGKIELIADVEGLFTVDVSRLYAANSFDNIMIATRHTNQVVHPGDKLAGTRIIPLVIDEKEILECEKVVGSEPLLAIHPWKLKTAGVITTGSEVEKGLIQDQFTPVVIKKLEAFGIKVIAHVLSGDDKERILAAIEDMKKQGCDMILCTGGMSVDPDDKTPGAIKESGARSVTYGAPTRPGAMLCLGYFEEAIEDNIEVSGDKDDSDTEIGEGFAVGSDDGSGKTQHKRIPIVGLPGCVMYAKATIFDLILPRLAADVEISKKDIIALGHGGLCLGCKVCTYPNCGFGKGGC